MRGIGGTRIRATALAVGAVLGCLCVLSAVAGLAFGVTPLVFRSGSMSPEIPAGSLALARSAPGDELRVGDVVSVENAAGTRITHRIVDVQDAEDQVGLRLKGDANGAVDAERYDVREADRVVWHVPVLGYAVAWTSGPVAVFLGGLLCGVLLMVAFGPGSRPPTRRGSRRAERRSTKTSEPARDTTAARSPWRPLGVAAAGVAVVVGAAAAVPGTLAAFVDNATATSGAIASTAMTTPTAPTATQTTGTGKVALGWATAPLADGTTAAGYRVLRYDAATGGTSTSVCTTTTDRTCSVDPSSSQVWYAVQALYGTAWESTVSPRTSLTADTTAPTTSIVQPVANSQSTESALRSNATSTCGTGYVACGRQGETLATMSTVRYQLTRVRGTSTSCWTGSAWTSGACTAYQDANLTTSSVSGSSAWRVPGAVATAYPDFSGTQTYTLVVQATDTMANTSTTTFTFSAT